VDEHDFSLENLDLSAGDEAFLAAMDAVLAKGASLPEQVLPSEWIFQNVEFTQSDSSMSGNVELMGFQREIADCLVDPEVKYVVVKKGTQVGYSMTTALLTIFSLCHEAARVIYYQPTDKEAQEYFEEEIAPRRETVKAFARIVRDTQRGETQDKWSSSRYRNGGVLLVRGAASDDAARRVKARRIFLDEINAEAWQSRNRENTQGNKVKLLISAEN